MAVGGSHTRCWRGGSTEAQRWVFAQSKQVPWQELVPFGILAGGWAGEMALVRAFVPSQTELCCPGAQQLSSHCPPAFPLSEQSCSLMTSQMLSPACCRNTLHLAPPLLQARLGGSAWPGSRPSAPAPSRQSVERAPPRRPSYPLPWASRVRLAPATPFC